MDDKSHGMMTEPVSLKFEYTPLTGIDAIRLLIIKPGQAESDIHCCLIHAALSECTDDIYKNYTALSYVWGDANRKRTIFVNELPFEVTSNLFDALHDLRHEEERLRLWADAICIDQSNLDERNIQVGLMRKIYTFAAFTVVYLGKSNEECDEVINAVVRRDFNEQSQKVIASQILTRSWFSRVWTYQELVLSRVPILQCGGNRVRWNEIYEFVSGENLGKKTVELATAKGDENNIMRSSDHVIIEAARIVYNIHNARNRAKPPSLLSILSARRGCGVFDQCDLIYGQLTVANILSEGSSRHFPPVDYQRSVIDVFTDAARYIIQEANVIGELKPYKRLLCHAEVNRYNSHLAAELPS